MQDAPEVQPSSNVSSIPERFSRRAFIEKTLIVIGTLTAVIVGVLLIWVSIEVILLVFAGVLLATLLNIIAGWISRNTGVSYKWSLAAVLLGIVIISGVAGWLLFPVLKSQVELLITELPQSIERISAAIRQSPTGSWILDQIPPRPSYFGRPQTSLLTRITGYFSAFISVVVYAFIVIASGIYFAARPRLYFEGITKLLPKRHQDRVREVLDTLSTTLRRWLVGRFMVMAINGTLTAIGLWILGSPIPILLGVITAILNFIPNIGPFLGAIPAVLLALMMGFYQALYVAILYLAIQTFEGFVLTPLVQSKSIQMPPVLILSSQLLLGVWVGFLGILLAVPVVAVIYVLVRMLYVEDLLGYRVEVLGEDAAKEKHGNNDER